jgi:hypothetical protein
VSLSVYKSNRVTIRAREAGGGGDFIVPQENLPVGVSETRTCPANLSGTRPGDRMCPIRGLSH